MKPPPITVKCECGEMKHVVYGDVWTCEQCGKRWNTAQIARDDYEGILREMRQFRLTAIGAAVVIGVGFTVLALVVSQSLFLLLPVVLAGWYICYMPLWRAKVRRRARNLPKWHLTPE
jgi:Flp pilus assembly protein TadB